MPETTKPSQEFVNIKEIKDGVIYLKSGGLRRVLIVSGVNFDLKSEDEQNLILRSFQNFLNTLDFSVQFFIHSRKMNIAAYLEKMKEREREEQNELLKIQIEEYIGFIKSFVEQNAIISKTFFLVIPYETVAIPQAATGILNLFKKSPPVNEKEKSQRESLEQLGHRVDQIASGLEQIGLRAIALADDELTELFYNLYNPQLTEKRGLEITKN